MQHDLDLGVGQHLGQRRGVDLVERVEQRDPRAVRRRRVVDDDLHEAQQRAVAALGHELGVDPERAALARGERAMPSDSPRMLRGP